MKIIIPARLGSKGLPFKNRELFKYTADSIPTDKADLVWVTTDDFLIKNEAKNYGFNVIDRPASLSGDTASTRDVLLHALEKIGADEDEFITMLYLTYPERTWDDIKKAMLFFIKYYERGITKSLLCKKEVEVHPYLCLQEYGANNVFGRQLVQHDLYRRQDYPKCFELSHFILIFIANEIYNLNKNMYCNSTVFYNIDNVIDIDYQEDLNKFNESTDECSNDNK